ncbi:galanin receptor type 1-like isoform X2 [Xenia sp. Carnegie-2017]|nr:galanin receptor type 1-like isoform X2 [Xenia sp. Carnegie-2017]
MNNSGGILSEVRRDNLTAQFQEPRGVKFARIVIEILISVFGVFGNTLVCMAIWRNKRLQNIGNIFIFNLSIADLGVLLMCLPLLILNADLNFSWPFGDMGCKLLLPLTDVFYGVSIGSIVAISFHRYRLIVHCMDHQMSARKAKLIVAFIWIISYVLFVLPLHFVVELKTKDGRSFCAPVWEREIYRQLHVAFVSLLFYVLPLALIVGTYARIRRQLRGDPFLRSLLRHDSTNSAKIRLDQNNKALKILTPVVVTFSILMFPINAIRLAAAFGKDLHVNFAHLRLVYNISVLLLLTNSSINCIIYAVVNNDFRKEFKRILSCCALKRTRLTISRTSPKKYSMYSSTDPKTVEETVCADNDSVFLYDSRDELRKPVRTEKLLKDLSRYEVRRLMEDNDYVDSVCYCSYGESVSIVVR